MPKFTGKLVFHNKAGKQFATPVLTGAAFDKHTLKISIKDGIGPSATGTIASNGTFTYQPKSDKIEWKVTSNNKGFPSFEQTQHDAQGNVDRHIYIVERNEYLGFAMAIEWPPRSISPR